MSHTLRAVYTCTPVAFHANRAFHIRDSGLIASELRKMGLESKCIMPLPSYEDDSLTEQLIRVEAEKLSDPAWWRTLGIDAVVLYSWGAPRYRSIARAIQKAGLKLLIHLDSSGDFWGGIRLRDLPLGQALREMIRRPLVDLLRARHLSYADYITASPPTRDILRFNFFYGPAIADKMRSMPCPVASDKRYDGTAKRPEILLIGRWDDPVKRLNYAFEAIRCLFTSLQDEIPPDTQAAFYGNIPDELRAMHARLPEEIRRRIRLEGYVDNADLCAVYSRAQIICCTSRSEGTHNVSAEALCCGCSVVVSNRPAALRTVIWYTTRDSGRVSEQDSPASFACALRDELLAWQRGERDAVTIARAWQPVFHVDRALTRIFGLDQPDSA